LKTGLALTPPRHSIERGRGVRLPPTGARALKALLKAIAAALVP